MAIWSLGYIEMEEFVMEESKGSSSPYLTTAEMAEKLKISIRTLMRHVSHGLPALRIGGFLRFEEQEVIKWFHKKSLDSDTGMSKKIAMPIQVNRSQVMSGDVK